MCVGGPCELPLTGDLRDWEQEQPRNEGISVGVTSSQRQTRFPALALLWGLIGCFCPLFSPRMTRTATTATSVLCVCLTCATPSSSPAGICASATRVLTRCATRPTTVPSAGCVRAPSLKLHVTIWRSWKMKKPICPCGCVAPTSLQSPAADQSCEEKARRPLPRVLQPSSGPDHGPWRALGETRVHVRLISV